MRGEPSQQQIADEVAHDAEEDIPVIHCHHCRGGVRTTGCSHCNSTGKLFWINGYAFPYTPEGEQRAKRARGR